MAHDRDPILEGITAGSAASPGQLTYFDDLNAVRMFLFNSLLEPKEYLAQRQKTTFQRSSFLIQSLSQSLQPKSGYSLDIDHNMLVEFYALDYVEALQVSGDLLLMLGAADGRTGRVDRSTRSRGLVLPYWNVDDPQNPTIQTDEWWAENSNFPAGSVPRMGCRVTQESVVVNHVQDNTEVLDLQNWTVSCTFRMCAPRVLYDYTLERPLTAVKLTGVLSG